MEKVIVSDLLTKIFTITCLLVAVIQPKPTFEGLTLVTRSYSGIIEIPIYKDATLSKLFNKTSYEGSPTCQ